MTCLLEVPEHIIAFLYMKPELWVTSRDKSECINCCKKHKVTQTKKMSIQAFGFFRKRCSTFASTSKICARAFEQQLNFVSISKIRDHLLPLRIIKFLLKHNNDIKFVNESVSVDALFHLHKKNNISLYSHHSGKNNEQFI